MRTRRKNYPESSNIYWHTPDYYGVCFLSLYILMKVRYNILCIVVHWPYDLKIQGLEEVSC